MTFSNFLLTYFTLVIWNEKVHIQESRFFFWWRSQNIYNHLHSILSSSSYRHHSSFSIVIRSTHSLPIFLRFLFFIYVSIIMRIWFESKNDFNYLFDIITKINWNFPLLPQFSKWFVFYQILFKSVCPPHIHILCHRCVSDVEISFFIFICFFYFELSSRF